MKRSELANRIWRTVVVSGAMLGGIAAADTPKPQPQQAKPITREAAIASLQAELRANDVQVAAAIDAITKTKTDADRKAATAKLAEVRKARAVLEDKLATIQKAAGTGKSEETAKREQELRDLEVQLGAAVDAVIASKTQAERDAAKARLDKLRAQKVAAEAALAKTLPPQTPLQKLEAETAELSARVALAIDAVTAAQTQADRDAATAKLKSLQAEKQALEVRITAEKAKARPRTNPDERPVGRGFVLA
ncbi:MAG: hypothetical protein ABI867_40280 [Kofleriaceae bacterium]